MVIYVWVCVCLFVCLSVGLVNWASDGQRQGRPWWRLQALLAQQQHNNNNTTTNQPTTTTQATTNQRTQNKQTRHTNTPRVPSTVEHHTTPHTDLNRCGHFTVPGMRLPRNSAIGLAAYFVGLCFPRMLSLIKIENEGMKDDQIPSSKTFSD